MTLPLRCYGESAVFNKAVRIDEVRDVFARGALTRFSPTSNRFGAPFVGQGMKALAQLGKLGSLRNGVVVGHGGPRTVTVKEGPNFTVV